MQSKNIGIAAVLAGAIFAGTTVVPVPGQAKPGTAAPQAKQKVVLLSVSGMH